jgi:hypothetical protein
MYCSLLSLVLGVVPYYSTGLLFVLAIKQVVPEQLCIVVRAHFIRYHVARLRVRTWSRQWIFKGDKNPEHTFLSDGK